jgi:LacI family transcriptional regulator
MENPVAYDHLRVVVRAAFEAGYTVLVADGQDSAEIQEAELARIRDFRVDGLIVGRGVLQVTPALLEFVRSGVPVEPALSEEVLNSNMHGVVVPFSEFVEGSVGAIVGFRRLIELGHTRFALFHLAERPARLTESRYKLLARMLAEAELPMPERIPVQIGRFADCTAEVQRLAASNPPPTAIISANGRLTPYILEGMQSAGLRIPADVSLLCFGDSQWHRAYSPPLAVVREDYEEVARATLARLVARIEGREYREVTARPSEFVMRGSIGAPPLDRRGTAGRSAANELSEETATP